MIFAFFFSGEALQASVAPEYLVAATLFMLSERDFLGKYFVASFALDLSMICENVVPFKGQYGYRDSCKMTAQTHRLLVKLLVNMAFSVIAHACGPS
jgi:hypothetical protein